MATLRKDGRWMSQKRTQKGRITGYGATPEEAEKDLQEKLTLAPIWEPSPNAGLREFALNVWRPSLDRLDEATVKRYTSSWRMYINEYLGIEAIAGIRRLALDRWVLALRKAKVPEPSIRYAITVLSNIMRMAVDYEIILRNPVTSLKRPPKAMKRERFMSIDQAVQLFDRCKDDPLGAPLFFAAVLGLRQAEIAGLKWSALDRQRGELRIKVQRRPVKGDGVQEKGLKTTTSYRTHRLSKRLIEEIDARGNLDSLYICTYKGKPWVPNTIWEKWSDVREKWGFPDWTFHDLRHGAAGLLYATGSDLLEIAAVLGHGKPDMTVLYTSISADRAEKAIGGLADRLFPAVEEAPESGPIPVDERRGK